MEYETVEGFSKVYDLQAFYLEMQARTVEDFLVLFTEPEGEDVSLKEQARALRKPHSMLSQLLPLHKNLVELYRGVLDALAEHGYTAANGDA